MPDPGYRVRGDGRVLPEEPGPGRKALVADVQRVAWPLWTEPGARIRRDVTELCRLQAARGLTVLGLLALGDESSDVAWLLGVQRLSGPRQERMYGAAAQVPPDVRKLVLANWGWALDGPLGGSVVAAFLAGGAYPSDGYAAAHATVTLLRLWERHPDLRPMVAAAWAATRTAADWVRAAETEGPVFTYPAKAVQKAGRPWVARLLHGENKIVNVD
ncbi:hypothetical protein [Actinocorallia longicatena]|uniref:Uncharacterized protein n=1 Tax=Actinocorallia longicatena TaxID=111803 RepID=A0ABP6QPK7_9ACTN